MSDKRTSERKAWLRRNQNIWRSVPFRCQWWVVDHAFEVMQVAGLYSFKTLPYDVRSSLGSLMRSIHYELYQEERRRILLKRRFSL